MNGCCCCFHVMHRPLAVALWLRPGRETQELRGLDGFVPEGGNIY